MITIQELKKHYNRIYPNGNWDIAYKVYLNAFNNKNNYCIMGRRKDIDTIIGQRKENESLLILEENIANFFYTDESQPGNVLHIANWSLGFNDAWLIGGISSSSTFNFVSEKDFKGTKDELEDFIKKVIEGEKYPTTVTAREILGLKCAQYTPHIISGALLFTPSKNTNELELSTYYTNIQNFAEKSDLINVIRTYLSPVFKN